MTCDTCHAKPSAVFDSGHIDTPLPAELTFGSLATFGGAPPTWSTPDCTNTYCHDSSFFATSNHGGSGSDETPAWGATAYQSGSSPRTEADCGKCHFYNTSGGVCSGCHNHVDDADETSFDGTGDITKHMDGVIQGAGDCVGCHSGSGSGVGKTNNRDAVGDEFGLAWGHKRTGRGAVTVYDCGVCHMEGAIDASELTTGGTDPSYHNNGKIELRDPDSATGALLYEFASGDKFNRDVGSNTITAEVAAVLGFCLACHDSDGSVTQSGSGSPSATDPWATGASVTDIESQFNSTVTFHPVTQFQNNNYAYATGMLSSPWDGGGSTHYKITCWDCHNKPTELTTRSVTAHGTASATGAEHMRADPWVTAGSTPLCLECHPTGKYVTSGAGTASAWGTATAEHDGTFNDGPGHAYGLHGKMDAAFDAGCHTCHGGRLAAGTRKQQGEDVHGSNLLGDGSSTWTSGVKGYAFFRNYDVYGGGTNVYDWMPASSPEGGGGTEGTCAPTTTATTNPCYHTGYHPSGTGSPGKYQPGGSF
jgi:hypothetical protein